MKIVAVSKKRKYYPFLGLLFFVCGCSYYVLTLFDSHQIEYHIAFNAYFLFIFFSSFVLGLKYRKAGFGYLFYSVFGQLFAYLFMSIDLLFLFVIIFSLGLGYVGFSVGHSYRGSTKH